MHSGYYHRPAAVVMRRQGGSIYFCERGLHRIRKSGESQYWCKYIRIIHQVSRIRLTGKYRWSRLKQTCLGIPKRYASSRILSSSWPEPWHQQTGSAQRSMRASLVTDTWRGGGVEGDVVTSRRQAPFEAQLSPKRRVTYSVQVPRCLDMG